MTAEPPTLSDSAADTPVEPESRAVIEPLLLAAAADAKRQVAGANKAFRIVVALEFLVAFPLMIVAVAWLKSTCVFWVVLSLVIILAALMQAWGELGINTGQAADNLANGADDHARALAAVRSGSPFVLYLRNHTPENSPSTYGGRGGPATSAGPPSLPHFGSRREEALVARLDAVMPVVAVGNWNEPLSGRRATRLWTRRECWPGTVVWLGRRAAVVVLEFTEPSPGVLREIDWLAREGVVGKTLLVTSRKSLKTLEKCRPGFADRVRWRADRPPSRQPDIYEPKVWPPVELPADLLAILSDPARAEDAAAVSSKGADQPGPGALRSL